MTLDEVLSLHFKEVDPGGQGGQEGNLPSALTDDESILPVSKPGLLKSIVDLLTNVEEMVKDLLLVNILGGVYVIQVVFVSHSLHLKVNGPVQIVNDVREKVYLVPILVVHLVPQVSQLHRLFEQSGLLLLQLLIGEMADKSQVLIKVDLLSHGERESGDGNLNGYYQERWRE